MAQQFTQRLTLSFEKTVQDQFGLTGRTTEYEIQSAKVQAADKFHAQDVVLSAGLSAYPLTIAPLGANAPAMLLLLCTDQPVDIRTNAADDTYFLSSVRLLALGGFVSNVFITTGSAATTVMLKAAGGDEATLTASFPLP